MDDAGWYATLDLDVLEVVGDGRVWFSDMLDEPSQEAADDRLQRAGYRRTGPWESAPGSPASGARAPVERG